MTGSTSAALAHVLPWTAAGVLLVAAATFCLALALRRHNVVDVAWGLFFVAVAVVAYWRSSGAGDPARRLVLLLMPVLWGLRLAVHIGRRSRGRGEDPRYDQLLGKAPGNRNLYALRTVYGLQALLAFLISAPIQVGMVEHTALGVSAWAGVALWLVGVGFEAVGDAQLERFRRDPAGRGRIMDRGLWRYTRHPNYFGDACVWWGIYLVAAGSWPGALTVPAPILMTLLLTKGSGVRILERHMAGRPGWDDYVSRTSPFVPLPPRTRTRSARP